MPVVFVDTGAERLRFARRPRETGQRQLISSVSQSVETNKPERMEGRGAGASNGKQKTKRRFTVIQKEPNKLAWFLSPGLAAARYAARRRIVGPVARGPDSDRDADGVTAGRQSHGRGPPPPPTQPPNSELAESKLVVTNWKEPGSAREVYGGRLFFLPKRIDMTYS